MKITNKLPIQFEMTRSDNVWFVINKQYHEVVKYIINNSARIKVTDYAQGRGTFRLVKINRQGIKNIVIRHYYRGGLIGAWFLRDLFLDFNRPINELIITEQARAKGVPVPEILGLVISRVGMVFYRAEIILKEVPQTQNLNEIFSGLMAQSVSPETLRLTKLEFNKAIAGSIKLLHQVGIYHRDLNIRNILIQRTNETGLNAYIIDFDKSKRFNELHFKKRIHNLIRLNRSIEKWGWSGNVINNSDRIRMVNEYLKNEKVDRAQKVWLLKQCKRELMLHSHWWKIMGK
ncbi:lipopolysaccharide kinase InaA family protein [Planctomycetota bacterium]